MIDSVSLSALGRDVRVGNLYNYVTDEIISDDIQTRRENILIKTTIDTVISFTYQQPDKCKLLGINSRHLKLKQLWFAKYVETPSTKDEAEVTVFFRIVRRAESLDQSFIRSQMSELNNRAGRATHLVEEVVYGSEIICSMSRPIDKYRETKESAEKKVYLAAKKYFDRIIGTNSSNSCHPPAELDNVSCTVFSTLQSGYNTKGLFPLFSGWLQNVINNKNHAQETWRPVEIVLRPFPTKTEEKNRQAIHKQEGYYKKNAASLDDGNQFRLVNGEYPSTLRIAEYFVLNAEYSERIQRGQPDIYLLKARENSSGEEIRWFDIGMRDGALHQSNGLKNHKVIILMGATGCGKSTLINGMVNYIFGVKWGDTFRFKCIREDESASRNQAHSQTRYVTAYTIHHKEGMAITHSVTIIDTPGYGDTGGVARDKEITKKIQQFLIQKEAGINEIHAACFVATSGDSRLTVTQRYILDSVLSTFGKDFKQNIRLLVTFADNADPPVVDACIAANFPVTSVSTGITYSKFNSSVLYAPNRKKLNDGEDFYFDELFWDMGQENFEKFFRMLEKMEGRDLKSTRNVIRLRQQLEKSLDEIESELEACLITIENMDTFLDKMKQYDQKMETNKNYVMEKTILRQTKVDCKMGFKAYNCRQCAKTCTVYNVILSKPKKDCVKCNCPESKHEAENFELRLVKEKVKTTLLDMKEEYESNCVSKMGTEQLVEKCVEDLQSTKWKVISLLEQVEVNGRSLDSTALRSNALSPADYLSLMRSRVAEQQAPGYVTRLETLNELQQMLNTGATRKTRHIVPADGRPDERNKANQAISRPRSQHILETDDRPADTSSAFVTWISGNSKDQVDGSNNQSTAASKISSFVTSIFGTTKDGQTDTSGEMEGKRQHVEKPKNDGVGAKIKSFFRV